MSAGLKRPITQVLPIAEELQELLRPVCDRIEIAGSIRRQVREVSDIELVAIPKVSAIEDLFGAKTTDERNFLWEKLDLVTQGRYLQGATAPKARKFMWSPPGHEQVKIDLYTGDAACWGWLLLYRTGSEEFSRHVATQLNRQGYTSHEGRIYLGEWERGENGRRQMVHVGKPIPTPTEARVFDLAHVQEWPPYQRR